MNLLIEVQAYPSFALTILFVIVTIIVLSKSRTNVNIFFSFGSFVFGIGTFFAGLGYVDESFRYLWTYATICLTLAPCGYFISAKLIVDGDLTFRSLRTYVLLLITGISSIGILIIYPQLSEGENIKIWDIVLVVILLFCLYEFYRVYILVPELRQKISFLLFGLSIAIIGLTINLILLYTINEGTLLRTIVPTIGQIFVALSFTSIPDSMRRSKT